MIKFQNKKYELLFSNNLAPLQALNYADELFFKEFKKILGKSYRIISIIEQGWQKKYGLVSDLELLKKKFKLKINDYKWGSVTLKKYEIQSKKLKNLLSVINNKEYFDKNNNELIKDLIRIRNEAALLDAMSNLLYLFSSLVGNEFYSILKKYTKDKSILNDNFVYYTQPIKESRFAKIKIKKLTNLLKLNKRDLNFSSIIRIGAFIKDDVSDLLDLRSKMANNLYLEISKRIKCSKESINYLQIKEIEQLLKSKNNHIRLITERKKITVLFYLDNKLNIYEGDKARKFLNIGGLSEVREKANLRGQIACQGIVKGRAVLAHNSQEANKKMRKGDILIAVYTAVEYLSAMKKAVAIVTETGGITSHAAIIAREFNIPCIIGVKDVMKTINDGNLIEVDANKGVIKILK
ncbi:MAG: PEP-utilizing enzyme [Planctomycetes bacterium]|jgi:phosphohistidine swiveling domain-containing protein|nr:PEP-utilizing enzyme [Planctomycetota bacterium]